MRVAQTAQEGQVLGDVDGADCAGRVVDRDAVNDAVGAGGNDGVYGAGNEDETDGMAGAVKGGGRRGGSGSHRDQ